MHELSPDGAQTPDSALTPDRDCAAVLNRLYAFLDGECVEAEADTIRTHLDACDNCVEDADVAQALKALIKRGCHAEAAPATFRTRILTQYSSGGYTSVRYTEVRGPIV